jgi:hypothetical protein
VPASLLQLGGLSDPWPDARHLKRPLMILLQRPALGTATGDQAVEDTTQPTLLPDLLQTFTITTHPNFSSAKLFKTLPACVGEINNLSGSINAY